MIKKTIGFPFELQPVEVEVTHEHIRITYRQLLWTAQEEIIPIKDIHNIEVDSAPFFAELIIVYGIPEKQVKIDKFRKADARALEQAIQVLIEQ